MEYGTKLDTLRDLFGCHDVMVEAGVIRVSGRRYPVVDGVIVLLDEAHYSPGLRRRLQAQRTTSAGADPDRGEAGAAAGHIAPAVAPSGLDGAQFAPDIQHTFGEEWQRFPEILPEHELEFEQYFDVVDLECLRNARVCDLGCGIGRWSWFLHERCRELVLVDFSDAIFVARRNLAAADHALFFMGDLKRLPFRDDFADFILCLGVLHHLPTDVLGEVRALRRYAPRLLVYLYYALDNRPAHYRGLLAAVTMLRKGLARVTGARVRAAMTWILAVGVYLPLVGAGHLLRPVGLARHVPLWDFYRDKSVRRIRQDVYDRFFTRIEQRVTRAEILELRDTYRRVTISDEVPYWHFLAER
jgi:SAM-dependent methyltransferase